MKIIYYVASSLDGFIAARDGSIDWLDEYNSTSENYGYKSFLDSIDGLVLGRKTYQQILGFGEWPYAGKPAFVLTGKNLTSYQDDVIAVSDIDQVLTEIDQKYIKRLWLIGGGFTATEFLKRGLLTELIVTYIPIMLGDGIRLFSLPATEKEMKIINTRTYSNGVVQLHYSFDSTV